MEQLPAAYLALENENVALRSQLEWLQRQMFSGGKSERLDPAQLKLKLLDQQKLIEQTATPETITYERRRASREKPPLRAEAFAHLPVKQTVVIEPEEVVAEPDQFERIGEESSFEVDVVPPQLFKREFVRPKYSSEGSAAAAPGSGPGAGASGGGRLRLGGAVGLGVDHAPLYRVEKMSSPLGRTAAAPEYGRVGAHRIGWLEPIYQGMHRGLCESGYVQGDETPVRCHDPDQKRGKTKDGWLWVMSRPGGDVVFDWRLSRQHGELTSLIDGFAGILQSDGYGAYAAHAAAHPEVSWVGLSWVGCWAHARRKFFDAQGEQPRVAQWILRLIAGMYHQEKPGDQAGIAATQRRERRPRYFTGKLYGLRVVVLRLRQHVFAQIRSGQSLHLPAGPGVAPERTPASRRNPSG